MREAVVVLAVTMSLFAGGTAEACMCAGDRTIAGNLPRYDVAVVVEVLQTAAVNEDIDFHQAFSPPKKPGSVFIPYLLVNVRVLEVWKGTASPFMTFVTTTNDSSCGYPFRAGETYIVLGTRGEPEPTSELTEAAAPVQVDLCSPTRRVSDRHEIEALRPAGVTPRFPNWVKTKR